MENKDDSIKRFESRFGNIAEFKKKVAKEHWESGKCTAPKGQCLECLGAMRDAGIEPPKTDDPIPY